MVTVSPPSHPYRGPAPHQGGRTNRPIKLVVMHCTAGSEPGVSGSADSTIAYTKRTGVVSSYHYVRDSVVARQFVWDGEVAYHCGHNSNSIGYELCCSLSNSGGILVRAAAGAKALTHWQTPSHIAMLRGAAEDVARICINEDIPIRKLTVAQVRAGEKGICGHVDVRDAFPGVTTHWDPGPFFPWRRFIRMVRRAAKRLQTPPAPPLPIPPSPTPQPQPGEPTPEPPPEPEPVPSTPPHDLFSVGVLPGRWNAPLSAWLARHGELRDNGVKLIGLTEGTNQELVTGLQRSIRMAGWDSYHNPEPGPANVIHTWASDRFEMVGQPWKVKLTDIPVFTPKGYEQPDPYAVGIAIRDKQSGEVILWVQAHLPLENTDRRRRAKEEAIATLKDKAFDEGRAQFPDAARMFLIDWNRRAHQPAVQKWFQETWPGMVAGWATENARQQGPDWVAIGRRLVHIKSVVLPRKKGDPLDHTSKISELGWR